MYQRFLTFLNTLIEPEERLLLAVSGGVDSMVLAHLMHQSGLPFGVAHVNYKLRREASDGDATFVKDWCLSRGIPFFLHEVNPSIYESSESTQMVARTIRYEFFRKLLQNEGYHKVATAHHLNDSMETVLFNLAKGTGIAGLTGIDSQQGVVIRPLLFATREEILAFAHSEKIHWREDASNASADYSRNFIRHEVIPQLRQINPALERTFEDTQLRLLGTRQIQDAAVRRLGRFVEESEEHILIDLSWLRDDAASLVLFAELLRPYGFHFKEVKDIFRVAMAAGSGKVFFASEYQLELDRQQAFIRIRNESEPFQALLDDDLLETPNGKLRVTRIEGNAWKEEGGDTVFLDASKLSLPLTVRTWQPGDWLIPLGMTGKKKVSDLMIDSKIPVTLKRHVLVMESAGNIAWVVGVRLDDRFKVTPETSLMYKVALMRNA